MAQPTSALWQRAQVSQVSEKSAMFREGAHVRSRGSLARSLLLAKLGSELVIRLLNSKRLVLERQKLMLLRRRELWSIDGRGLRELKVQRDSKKMPLNLTSEHVDTAFITSKLSGRRVVTGSRVLKKAQALTEAEEAALSAGLVLRARVHKSSIRRLLLSMKSVVKPA